jgi:hypothetical protein
MNKTLAILINDKETAGILILALSDYRFKRKHTLKPEVLERIKEMEKRLEEAYVKLSD